jgi:hypothetical protein
VLGLTACGHTSAAPPKPKHAAVPNVVGARAADAVVTIEKAGYCVTLEIGNAVPAARGLRVQSQSPAPGAARNAWSPVMLTIGIPTRPGMPKHRYVALGVDSWGGKGAPCPKLAASGTTR